MLPLDQQHVLIGGLHATVQLEGEKPGGGGDDGPGLKQGRLELVGATGLDSDDRVLEDHGP